MFDPRTELLERNLEDLVNELLFEQVPHIFGGRWPAYRTWKLTLAKGIHVDPSEITIVGSAATGLSLSPGKNFKPFDAASDVDVAIVSDYYFSEAWHHLRSIDLILDPLTPPQKSAINSHKRNYIYSGCVATDRVLALMPFAGTWLTARSALAGTNPTEEREINFRIYKDFRALRSYQLTSLRKLREELLTGGQSAEFSD